MRISHATDYENYNHISFNFFVLSPTHFALGTGPLRLKQIRANLELFRQMRNYSGTEFWCRPLFLFRDHPNPMRKNRKILIHLEIFCFEHSGRFIVPPQTASLSYVYDYICTTHENPGGHGPPADAHMSTVSSSKSAKPNVPFGEWYRDRKLVCDRRFVPLLRIRICSAFRRGHQAPFVHC